MEDEGTARRQYREWAAAQADLPIYFQPGWLSLVGGSDWRATMTHRADGSVAVAWPYLPRRRLGLRLVGLPPATPYLGPVFPTGCPPDRTALPAGVGYAAFTVHDPRAAWVFGRRCRAMATQVLDLSVDLPLDSDLRRRLRRGREALRVREATEEADYRAFTRALIARPQAGAPTWPDIFRAAHFLGLARVYLVEDASGRAHGFAAVPYDSKTGYLTALVRTLDAHPSTATVLLEHIAVQARQHNLEVLDLQSGYLPGVRRFYLRFGARPRWYGLVRLPANKLYGGLDLLRATTSSSRL